MNRRTYAYATVAKAYFTARLLSSLLFFLTVSQQIKAQADLSIAGPPTPTAAMLSHWYQHRLPTCFQAADAITLYPLCDHDMDTYLTSIGLRDGTSSYADSSDGEIDGLFVNRQKRISVRVDALGGVDMETLSHEYGHYVWFHLFSKAERGEYRGIYKQQSRAGHLVTDYAATNLEEGFAEAFAYFLVDPAKLNAADPASYRFLLACVASREPASLASLASFSPTPPAPSAPAQIETQASAAAPRVSASPPVAAPTLAAASKPVPAIKPLAVEPLAALILAALGSGLKETPQSAAAATAAAPLPSHQSTQSPTGVLNGKRLASLCTSTSRLTI